MTSRTPSVTSMLENDTDRVAALTTPGVEVVVEEDQPIHLFFLVLSGVIEFFIITGNALTVFTVLKFQYLRTPVYFLVASLSVSHLIVGVSTPYHLVILHTYTEKGIRLVQTNRYACLFSLWVLQVSICSAVFNLLAVSIERFLAVVYPLKHGAVVSNNATKVTITLIWVSSLVLSMPSLVDWSHWQVGVDCSFASVFPSLHFWALFATPVFASLLGLSTLFIVTLCIGWQRARHVNDDTQLVVHRAQMKITRMLATVIAIFFACWLPYITLSLVTVQLGPPVDTVLEMFYALSKIALSLQSAINPVVFAARSRLFRRGYAEMLCRNAGDGGGGGMANGDTTGATPKPHPPQPPPPQQLSQPQQPGGATRTGPVQAWPAHSETVAGSLIPVPTSSRA